MVKYNEYIVISETLSTLETFQNSSTVNSPEINPSNYPG